LKERKHAYDVQRCSSMTFLQVPPQVYYRCHYINLALYHVHWWTCILYWQQIYCHCISVPMFCSYMYINKTITCEHRQIYPTVKHLCWEWEDQV